MVTLLIDEASTRGKTQDATVDIDIGANEFTSIWTNSMLKH